MIPAELILDTPLGSSLRDAYDFIRVAHKSGGDSICYMRSYEQGSSRVQAHQAVVAAAGWNSDGARVSHAGAGE
jgi:hypothetical protein